MTRMKLQEVPTQCKLCRGYFVVYLDEEIPRVEARKVAYDFVCADCSRYRDLTGFGLHE